IAAVCPLVYAQDETWESQDGLDEDAGREPTPPPGRGRRNARKKNHTRPDEAEVPGQTAKSSLFPDWPAPSFDWGIQPIVAATYRSDVGPGGRVRTTTLEGGLGAGLFGVPVVPGNIGFYLEPRGGYVFGS